MMPAHHHAQVWNASELARAFAVAVAHTTVQRYLDVLTFMVRKLQSWHENMGKRHRRRRSTCATAVCCHALLGLADARAVETHPKVGASREGFVLEAATRSMRVAAEDLRLDRLHVVHAGTHSFDLGDEEDPFGPGHP